MPDNTVNVVIWIRHPIPAKDAEGEPMVNEDGSFDHVRWRVSPERISVPAYNLTTWLKNIYKNGLIIADAAAKQGRFIPADWLCEAYFDLPTTGALSTVARAT